MVRTEIRHKIAIDNEQRVLSCTNMFKNEQIPTVAPLVISKLVRGVELVYIDTAILNCKKSIVSNDYISLDAF